MTGTKKKIVIIDDDKEFLEELSESLRLRGFEVIDIVNPFDAIVEISLADPDLVLLDLKMPQRNGLQVASEIIYKFGDIPVVAMSAFFKKSYNGILSSCGVKECFVKPFDIDKVAVRLNELINSAA